ncbi:MAG: IS66 family transposase [Planctomycetota bacterium]|nr:MAG: IS66 family transposase [Planctomycetota bacterium]
MQFCFYPRHEYACPEVGHCPHLGGAALATVVSVANQSGRDRDLLHLQLAAERASVTRLLAENSALQQQLQQVKLELRPERQSKFMTNRDQRQAHDAAAVVAETAESLAASDTPRKRGAPVGHPGWFRKTPTEFDQTIDVAAPDQCPHCGGTVRGCSWAKPGEHVQEDVVDGVYQVVVYRHSAARCRVCRRWVRQPGEGELLGSRIGPRLRALALFLRNDIGVSYRKVPRALQELFDFPFTPAALIGFEKLLALPAAVLANDIAQKIASTEGPVHADETYWSLNGERAYFWVHGTDQFLHFQFDTSRAGEVSRDVLGEDFAGTLVTDCYAGYEAHVAAAKQKCQAHLARTARDWQALTIRGSTAHQFFEDVKQFVKRGCAFHRGRAAGQLPATEQAAKMTWLRAELLRLESCVVDHDKALTLQGRLRKHHDEWLVFLDDPRVPPTNNLAERALRPLVVLRKITFGHRTSAGAQRMAQILSVQETAKRHGRRASVIFYRLLTEPPHRVLKFLYAGGAC